MRGSLPHSRFIRVIVFSLVLALGYLTSGCGAGGSGSDAASKEEMPESAKKLQEMLKKRPALQKGPPGKLGRGGPAGK
jgi:hypothetical protein